MSQYRRITQVFSPKELVGEDGSNINRIIGTNNLSKLDPFQLFEFFNLRRPSKSNNYPLRGFETVTYVMEGSIEHEDFRGNKGRIEAGEVSWITSGKGIVQMELPGQSTSNSTGFHFWVNLDKKNKMCDPFYRQFKNYEMPVILGNGVWIKLIAGEVSGGPVATKTPLIAMEVRLQQDISFQQAIPTTFQGLVFVYDGSAIIGENKQEVSAQQAAIFNIGQEDTLNIIAGRGGAKLMFLAGRSLNESVYKEGNFIMESQEALNQAFQDFKTDKNGFEGAFNWKSSIEKNQLK